MPASRAAATAAGQRSIRSMIALALIVPLVSLVALYAYSAYSAVGNALAWQHERELSNDLGGPMSAMSRALASERADALLYLVNPQALMSVPGHQATPLATLQAAESGTDTAAAAFTAADSRAAGLEQPSVRPLAANVISALATLPGLRRQIMNGNISLISAFTAYHKVYAPIFPFSLGLFDPNAPVSLTGQSDATLAEGDAAGFIAEQAAFMGAVAAAGGDMSPQEHVAFAQIVADEKQEESAGGLAVDWQQSPDPYPAFWATPAFQSFERAQTAIDAANPGVLSAADLRAWNRASTPVLAQESAEQAQARAGLTAAQDHQGTLIVEQLILVGGIGLLAVLLSAWLLLRFGSRVTRELIGLRGAARMLAAERLPGIVARLRAGEDINADAEAPVLALRTRIREVTETAVAFSVVQRTAVQAAVDQATLRHGVANVFRSLARRNHSLLQRQLKLLDGMERNTQDPDLLGQLFQLDHLTTRMRRQAEGLIILSGANPGRGWRQPVPVVEVLRGAISEIEDYARVDLLTDSPDFVQGTAVADVTHLLAELIENAVLYSPPNARVQVRGSRAANGYVVEVEDQGLGIAPEDRAVLNDRLARPPEFDLADSDQLGLFVVARLALRHDVRVSLRESGHGGTTAIVLLPAPVMVSQDEAAMIARRGRAALDAGEPAGEEGAPGAPTRPTRAPAQAPALSGPAFPESVPPGPALSGPALSGPGAGGPPGAVAAMPSRSGRPPFEGAGGNGNGGSPGSAQAATPEYPRRTPGASGAGSAFGGQGGGLARSAFDGSGSPATRDGSRAAAGDGAGQPTGLTPSGLPRRDRGVNLAPQLRDSPRQEPSGPLSGRSPEQARALLSSIQRGLRTGRDAGLGSNESNRTTGEEDR